MNHFKLLHLPESQAPHTVAHFTLGRSRQNIGCITRWFFLTNLKLSLEYTLPQFGCDRGYGSSLLKFRAQADFPGYYWVLLIEWLWLHRVCLHPDIQSIFTDCWIFSRCKVSGQNLSYMPKHENGHLQKKWRENEIVKRRGLPWAVLWQKVERQCITHCCYTEWNDILISRPHSICL